MQPKRFCSLLICLCLLAGAPAALAKPTHAEALFAAHPELGFPLTQDPQTDPLLMLVNRQHRLDARFKPELVTPKVAKKRGADIDLHPEAARALERLFDAAKAEGLSLSAISGYRSYGTQRTIYERSVERNGQARADRMSAPPGASEHQTGLAMDVSCKSLDHELTSAFSRKPEGKWVAAHCSEYGFILRYRKEWQDITGYQGEPWHIRYIGPQHAAAITALDVPFETYHAYLALVWQQQNEAPAVP